jgi:hypothetical protein
MKTGDLVTDKNVPEFGKGIIVEVRKTPSSNSKNVYITYCVYWFDKGFRSTHGASQLELIS